MITNKCKTDFEVWLKDQPLAPYPSMIWDVPEFVRNAFILQFFDSEGFFIDTFATYELNGNFDLWINSSEKLLEFDTRVGAQQKGIEIANKMYNDNK